MVGSLFVPSGISLRESRGQTGNQYLYVFGNLLSQGGPCTSNRLPFRLVAGVWTLAAFIFVQAYTSTLFTYVVAPVNHPLIDSMYDIADNPEIHLLVKNEGTPDRYFTGNNWTGFYEKLRDRINNFPQSRCTLVSECIDLVKPGSKNVFADAGVYQMDAIKEDYEKTGQCNFQLAKEDFNHFFASMSLPKNSRYTDTINKGLLDLQQTGIIDHWDSWFRTMPRKCMANIKYGYNTETKPSPLTLKNLTGAFIVLLIGSSLSLLAFLCEKILSMPKRHRRRINKL
ncbi:ionotropic receptor 93a-like [Daphnia pulicaria]|uniref:ionotropic receptor 93a-like n=1 Tax=Daphnia pulicaria TaxID=35523 RepID=UPI001EEBE27A|nr:ionotropic receptor 93a-like [Daphnia pulicaria]